ncbi:glycosyl transferase family 1 [Bacteroidia bacterium]|nr:glycosyl transferase family 1 [Bacteroidia bacterium]
MLKLIRLTTVPISFVALLKGQLHFMNNYFDVIGISSKGSHLEEVHKNEGIRVISIEMSRKITPLQDLKSLGQLYFLFRKERPTIVHTHTPKAGTLGMVAAWLARIPYRLHTVAGLPLLEADGTKRVLLNIVERLTYKCATKVYPNSYGLEKIILFEKLCSRSKLVVLANGSSNGINTSYFNPYLFSYDSKIKIELGIRKEDLVYIFVGRLVKDKGINELIQAFCGINKKHHGTKLLLVGSFERDLDPLLLVTENEINNNPNIISIGYKSDVRPYFSISDILVFPSYREGFPNVVMQAGAMELPSIVTNINGCNEIIVDGVNGLIIPPKNVEQLQEKMALLIEDSNLRAQLKQNAREMITSRYEQQYVWNALLEEYKSLESQVIHE